MKPNFWCDKKSNKLYASNIFAVSQTKMTAHYMYGSQDADVIVGNAIFSELYEITYIKFYFSRTRIFEEILKKPGPPN